MRAAVVQGLHRPLKVEQIPDPRPADDEVVIQVGRCGICGSDLHMTEDPMFGVEAGDVLGHEFAGEVVELGRSVEKLRVGDLVSVTPVQSCGQCATCLAGEPAWCSQMHLQGGGYGELAITRERQCMALPQSTSLDDGAIIEPMAVALHGVNLSGLKKGDRVLVIGAGPIGLSVAFWARKMGAKRVVVQDIVPYQQELALSVGATDFVCETEAPVEAAIRALGQPADITFECVGLPGIIAQAVSTTRVKGTVLVLGLCTQPDTLVPFHALSKELRLQTSAFFTLQDYRAALDVLDAGSVEPRKLITDTVELEELPETFEALKHRTHQCKVLIRFD
jgi:(R,R)-butanediol dehydrogenase/meso-butanediol dehydrogenase/diacetyl reductase